MYSIQLLLVSILTVYLIFRCFYVCKKQREPTRLYRPLGDEDDDDIPVERIVIPESSNRRLQRPETPETSPPPPWLNFDNVRTPRAVRSFVGPTVHGATRAPGGPPPSYSCAVNVPPPTYQQVISQRQDTANTTPAT